MFFADSILLTAVAVQSKVMHLATLGMVYVLMFKFVFMCICTYSV